MSSECFSCVLPDENEAEMAEKAADDDEVDSSNSSDGDDDEGAITEFRFVPGDKAACEWWDWMKQIHKYDLVTVLTLTTRGQYCLRSI